MKKVLSIVMILVLVLGFSITALATSNIDGFAITLDHIGDTQNTLYSTSFPIYQDVAVNVTYPTEESNSGTNIDNQTIQVKLFVSTTAPILENNAIANLNDLTKDDNLYGQQTIKRNSVESGSSTFKFTWAITDPGTYYIIVTAKKASDIVEAWQPVIIQQVIATQPAAPAVAARLLKEAGKSAKYGKTGNYISDVAREMQPTAAFHDIPKSNVRAYEAEVYNYLLNAGAFN